MLRWGTWLAAGWMFVALALGAGPGATQQHALKLAIDKKQKDAVAALIAAGADVNAPDDGGRTPLFLASIAGDPGVVGLLLSKGADLKARSTMRELSLRVAHRFSNSEHVYELMELLMARSGPNGGTGRGLTALHAAAVFDRQEVVRLLLERGAERDARDEDGNTPLMWATLHYGYRSAQLLAVGGADINARNRGHLTPLHAAAALAHSGMQSWLLENGARGDARDKDGWTPLHWTELTKRRAHGASGGAVKDIGVEEQELLRRLERLRLPLTALVLGRRNSEEALGTLLRLRDGELLEAYLPSYAYTPGSKFRMTKTKFALLQPLLKESWVAERTKQELALWMAGSGLPGIEPALLDALPFVSERAQRNIHEKLAERRYEPLLPHLVKRLGQPDSALCRDLALLGSAAALRAMIQCVAALTDSRRAGGHAEILSALAKHRGTASIDFPALRRALPRDLDEKTAARYYELVGLHGTESEVPELLAAVQEPDSVRARAALDALLRYESENVAAQTLREFDRLYAAGKVDKSRYNYVAGSIRERRALGSRKRDADLAHGFERDTEETNRLKRAAEQSRERKPEQFVREYKEYLAALAALRPRYERTPHAASIASTLSSEYSMLANFVRFRLRQPHQALALYAKGRSGAGGSSPWIDIQMADTYQYDIGNPAKAIEHYERARSATAAASAGSDQLGAALEAWFRAWLPHEIDHLKTGRRFAGAVKSEEIGAFGALLFLSGAANLGDPSFTGQQNQLERLAPSHLNFLKAVFALSQLPDEESVLRFFRKHDRSGYWSASLAGMLSLLDTELARGQYRSRQDDPFVAMLKDPSERPTALARAARSIAAAHGIRVAPRDERMATPEKTWGLFIQSLKAGDASTALVCFTPGMRSKLEALFTKMTADEMRRMAESFTAFSIQPGSDDLREALLVRLVGERQVAGFAMFVRQAGEWKIDSM